MLFPVPLPVPIATVMHGLQNRIAWQRQSATGGIAGRRPAPPLVAANAVSGEMQVGCLPSRRKGISIDLIRAMLFRTSRLPTLPPLFGRLLAGGCAALVVLLAVLAASPTLHEWLHRDACAADHECAVTLFQHGADAAVAATTVAAAAWIVVALAVVAPIGPDLGWRRYWLPPGNAPPALD
jgi:hypothetical protein